jgi:hypothetical protein
MRPDLEAIRDWGHMKRTQRSSHAVVGFVALVTTMLVAAVSSAGAQGTLSVTTTPALYPAFSTSVSDYVIRCTTPPVAVNVTAPDGTSVSVDGQTAQHGTFSANVSVVTGQEFTIVASQGNTSSTYYVRCLPTDFPNFTSTVSGTRQAQYYLTAPIAATAFSPNPPPTNYVTFFDNNGVPVWWKSMSTVPVFATNQPNGNVGWTNTNGTASLATLNGTAVRTITSPDGGIDFHELQRFNNGNDLVAVDTNHCCFDLSSWGGPSSATIYDQVLEELSPTGSVVWSWDPATHINPVVATAPQWRAGIVSGGGPYDVFHLNSLATNNGDVIISFRHLNAVYDVHKADGSMPWKLGGSAEPESLAVVGDPVFTAGGGFCGQHDARVVAPTGVLADGTLSVHDNGTNCNRAPRAVRYQINTSAHTATMVEQISDPMAPASNCCGSARKLPGGDWVASWGHQSYFTELTAGGSRVFLLQYTDSGEFSYRVKPIQPGVYTPTQLRAGMNVQYPH